MTPEQIIRIEDKIDKLTEAVNRLVLVEERQVRHGERMGVAESRLTTVEAKYLEVDKKLDRWINYGIGAWVFATMLMTIYTKVAPFFVMTGH